MSDESTLREQLAAVADDRLYAPEQDMWVRFEADGTATIGATHLVTKHGQFMFFAPRPPGTTVERDRSLGVMETAKTAVAIHAPLSCTILAANVAVEANAEMIKQAPYVQGWLFRIQPSRAEERALLLDAAGYRQWLVPRMDRFKPPIADEPDTTIDPLRGW